jgi:hypothetical protein
MKKNRNQSFGHCKNKQSQMENKNPYKLKTENRLQQCPLNIRIVKVILHCSSDFHIIRAIAIEEEKEATNKQKNENVKDFSFRFSINSVIISEDLPKHIKSMIERNIKKEKQNSKKVTMEFIHCFFLLG